MSPRLSPWPGVIPILYKWPSCEAPVKSTHIFWWHNRLSRHHRNEGYRCIAAWPWWISYMGEQVAHGVPRQQVRCARCLKKESFCPCWLHAARPNPNQSQISQIFWINLNEWDDPSGVTYCRNCVTMLAPGPFVAKTGTSCCFLSHFYRRNEDASESFTPFYS